MTDSRSSVGWKAVPSICPLCGLSFQLSLEAIRAPLCPRNSRNGSCRSVAAGSPDEASEGPRPRRTTAFGMFPVIMKPPIIILSPTSTRRRVEMFMAWAGVAVGVAVGLAVGVAVALAVPVAVAVGVAVAVAVAVAVGEVTGVAVAVAVAVGEVTGGAVALAVAGAVAVAVAGGVGGGGGGWVAVAVA